MGVCWVMACKPCRKRLDLNKNKGISSLFAGQPTDQWCGDLKREFRFLRRHWGHDVKLHSDHDESDAYGYAFNFEEEFGE
jgi:hypothetical protein